MPEDRGAEHAPDAPLGVSVVVATFRRLNRLAACLDGLESQVVPPEEVLVVTQADAESESYVRERAAGWRALRVVSAPRARSVAAYNAGLRAARMPIVSFIDDDAVPEIDWIERIVRTFHQDERIAGVGGRDVIFADGRPIDVGRRPRRRSQVGRIQWSGRMTANHHIAAGPARDVDVLKGVNMSFRRSEVVGHGFDERLLGPGAVVHAELSICLPLRRRGLRLVYDPSIVVMHHPAERPAGDHRASLSADAAFNSAHNEGLQIIEFLEGRRRVVFVLWAILVGNTEAPGLAVLARDLRIRKPGAVRRFFAAQRGRAAAWRSRRQPRGAQGAGLDQATFTPSLAGAALSRGSNLDHKLDACSSGAAVCIDDSDWR